MSAIPIHQVIDAFHRAAIGMGSWRDALSLLTTLSGGHVGQIAGVDRNGALVVNLVTGVSAEQVNEYIESGGPDPSVNPRSRAALGAAPLRTIGESDFGSYEALRHHPYYRGFFTRHQVPYSALTKLCEGEGRTIVMALMRSEKQGHLTEEQRRLIDACAPAIRDAVTIELAFERRQFDMMGGALDNLDVATFALSPSGAIVARSSIADALLGRGDYLSARRGILAPLLPERQCAFAAALAATARDHPAAQRRASKIIIPSVRGGPIMVAEIMPLPVDSDGWLQTACCLVTVRSRSERMEDLPLYLRERYRLTPSECLIVLHLVDGQSPRAIAVARGAAEGTVRNQIKAILAKTGFNRQIDLIRELGH